LHHTQTYYDPPPVQPDGMDPGSLVLLLIFVAFIVVLIWLLYWEPPKAKKKDEKSLREEIDGIFKDLRDNAQLYNRAEFIPSLNKAQDKIADVLDKRKLFNRT
jgi:hypothetical protein